MLNEKKQIIITEIESGQRRKYDDFHEKYNIQSNCYLSESEALKIGQALSYKELDYTKWLENERDTTKDWDSKASIHFKGYYSLSKVNDKEYTYYTNSPNCD